MVSEGSSMEHSGRKTGTAPKQELRAYILVHRQEAEREQLGLAWVFETSKTHTPSVTLLPHGHTFSFFLGSPPAWNRTLEYRSPWAPFSCRPHTTNRVAGQ